MDDKKIVNLLPLRLCPRDGFVLRTGNSSVIRMAKGCDRMKDRKEARRTIALYDQGMKLCDLASCWKKSRTWCSTYLRRTGRPVLRLFCINLARLIAGISPNHRMDIHLGKYGKRVYSQRNEDGIIEYIFVCVGATNKYLVEIGVGPPGGSGYPLENGLECNSRLLLEKGWTGIQIDGQEYPATLNVKTEFITAENINDVLAKYGVPSEFDLFSLDVDGNDYWIWKALKFEPRVVVIEYNPDLGINESKVIEYNPNFDWGERGYSKYYGASLLALKKLGEQKGYTLVYANGTNAFFVKTHLLLNGGEFHYEKITRGQSLHGDVAGNEKWIEV
jgi:hypothetical protein